MVASLRNVDEDLAAQVAEGLGLDLPDPLPLALEIRVKPEVTSSPALSLTALPGDAGVRTRKVAVLVANVSRAARSSRCAPHSPTPAPSRGSSARQDDPRVGSVARALHRHPRREADPPPV